MCLAPVALQSTRTLLKDADWSRSAGHVEDVVIPLLGLDSRQLLDILPSHQMGANTIPLSHTLEKLYGVLLSTTEAEPSASDSHLFSHPVGDGSKKHYLSVNLSTN